MRQVRRRRKGYQLEVTCSPVSLVFQDSCIYSALRASSALKSILPKKVSGRVALALMNGSENGLRVNLKELALTSNLSYSFSKRSHGSLGTMQSQFKTSLFKDEKLSTPVVLPRCTAPGRIKWLRQEPVQRPKMYTIEPSSFDLSTTASQYWVQHHQKPASK